MLDYLPALAVICHVHWIGLAVRDWIFIHDEKSVPRSIYVAVSRWYHLHNRWRHLRIEAATFQKIQLEKLWQP